MSDDARQDRGPRETRTRTMPRRRPLWKRVFLDNLGLKIASAVIALALGVLVREDKGKEVDIEVPVVLSNLSEMDVFVGELPRVLRVRVRDRWSRLARALERKPVPYLVDLRGFTDETSYVFDREKIRQLLGVSGLSIQSVYPSDFVVRIEPKAERVLAVRPTFVSEAQEGYDVVRDKVRVVPREVRVWGARSSVREVSDLATYPIDLSTLERDSRIEVALQKPNMPFLFLDEEKVAVEIPVRARQGRVTLDAYPIAIKNCPENLACHIEPASTNMTLIGPMPTLLKVRQKAVAAELWIDAADFEAAVTKHDNVRPTCDRPAGIECVLAPRTVTLYIQNPEAEGDRRPVHKPKP